MRIVQLLPELNEGGVERGVVELSRELVKRGHQSVVISHGGRLVEQVVADGGCHVCLDVASKNPLTVPGRVMQLRRMLREVSPDIVHVRSRVPAWLAVLANRPLRIPFVTTVHGFNSVNAYSRVMTLGVKVICVSAAIREFVESNYPVPAEKLVTILRGIDLVRFDPDHVDQFFMAEFRNRFDLHGKFVVSSVGRITQLKDYETFVEALLIVKRQIPGLVGLIVGGVREDKRDYHARLQQQVAASGATDFIYFTGSQSRVAEIYTLSDVVVSSSKKPESFGRSAAEAIAMGVPVAASRHGGMLEIVIPGITGELFSPGDAQGLAKAILECRQIERTSLRNFVSERFSLEKMVQETLAVYSEVTQSGS